jgi:phenylacetate-coenzyme A ligase PaaK-like adenylate-forming protein
MYYVPVVGGSVALPSSRAVPLAMNQGEHLQIPMVFYAGEALSPARREFLKKTWGVTYFGSAGYASVDAGVIAYQCDRCGPGVAEEIEHGDRASGGHDVGSMWPTIDLSD